MRVSGFVMVDEAGNALAKSDGSAADLLKAHVKGYVRKDGVQVKEHDDSRPDAKAAQPGGGKPLAPDHDFGAMLGAMKDGDTHHFQNSRFTSEKVSVQRKGDRFHLNSPFERFNQQQPEGGHSAEAAAAVLSHLHTGIKGEGLVHSGSDAGKDGKPGDATDHPHVVGQFSDHKVLADDANGSVAGNGDPTHPDTVSVKFGGREYFPTGKTGESMHDKTPVHEFEAEDGHRVWGDKQGRVHADSTSEVDHLRKLGGQSGEGEKAPRAQTSNPGLGYHGGAESEHVRSKHGPEKSVFDLPDAERDEAKKAADKHFADAADELVSAGHFASHKEAADFLDSRHGRHLADEQPVGKKIGSVRWLPKAVADYRKRGGAPFNERSALRKAVLFCSASLLTAMRR